MKNKEIIDILKHRTHGKYRLFKEVKSPNSMTPQVQKEVEVLKLMPLLRKITFFKEKHMQDDDLAYVCKKLKYEFVPNGYDVVTYGDIGDKFYITLHGTLGVFLPLNKVNKRKGKDKYQLDYEIKDLLMKKLKRQETEEFELPTKKILSRRRMGKIVTETPVDDASINLIAFHQQINRDQSKEVAILPQDCSFGELSLISEQPRSVTIRAKTDSHFAVLEKDDYK